MGGLQAIVNALGKKVKNRKGAQVITAILGIIVFFDDLSNILVVGPTMRPLSDEKHVSREKQAFIVHTTAGIVAGICIITTWGGFEIGLVSDTFSSMGYNVNAFSMIVQAIPYMFYNIFALAMLFFVVGMGSDFGPMLKAERRAAREGKLYADDAIIAKSNEEDNEKVEIGKMSSAIIPLVVLIGSIIVGLIYIGYRSLDGEVNVWSFEGFRTCLGEADPMPPIVWAAILATLVAAVIAKARCKFTVKKIYDTWITGFVSLAEMMLILVLSWSVGGVVNALGTADFLVEVTTGSIPASIIPAIIFLVACIISFSTGTSWGTMPILFPIAIPMAAAFVDDPTNSGLVIATVAAVLSGSIFGDQTSPISDSTVLTCASVGCDILHHVKTQAPYEVIPAIMAFIGYLVTGFAGVTPFIHLVIGIMVVILFVKFVGKKPDIVNP